MRFYDEALYPEPFDVEYVRPAPAPCPHCSCCSLHLCETAVSRGAACSWLSDDAGIVTGCPCSTVAAIVARQRPCCDHCDNILAGDPAGHDYDPGGTGNGHNGPCGECAAEEAKRKENEE